MSETNSSFPLFLEEGLVKGGFETDDILAALLPLLKQVHSVHLRGLVAPLFGLQSVCIKEQRFLYFDPQQAHQSKNNLTRVEAIQVPASTALEVLEESIQTLNLNDSTLSVESLSVATDWTEITKPMYLPGYRCWEQALEHHDPLTDIFSAGMLLASMACGLDFTEKENLEVFVVNRGNLFAVNRRLNPVLASVIVQMTELNRHKRAPDLAQLIVRLENYREQSLDLNITNIQGFKDSSTSGKRKLIQAHLRDRLFEISRRNRLIYFKPTLQSINLTLSSVPLLLDYRNIKLEQLLVWNAGVSSTLSAGESLSLSKYLRVEDAPYIPGALDKIISEARRDRSEYGFAQLRLVLCFLRWNNLKEAPQERIHSPLLLLPVEVTRKKGVRDNYVLAPTSTDAEINPVLRHHLNELYNLNLPEYLDLKESTVHQFYDLLKTQILASEPGITLTCVDRPQIQLIHEKANQRMDQYRRRMKQHPRKARSTAKPEYSYERENFKPLGLQLYLQKIRPTSIPLRQVMGAEVQPRLPHINASSTPLTAHLNQALEDTPVMEKEQKTYALHTGEGQNPYVWDFDLCNLTLGNFNYRKMTLVRDYAKLIETDIASSAFDTVFSLLPKPTEESAPPPLTLLNQYLVIPCDATQASAIARARTGASYIIQGPPGTGKSQTITNLIADYVARGKRVLFVCEKRAAIDVVFHRLRQQGLDELCCLIHDSQTDKKEFIQNLKQTYEQFLNPQGLDGNATTTRLATLRAMEQEMSGLCNYSRAMQEAPAQTGSPLRSLLHRLVELRDKTSNLPADKEERLPGYGYWLQHGHVVDRLSATLKDMGEDLCFARHPLRCLSKEVLLADRPQETLLTHLDQAEKALETIHTVTKGTQLSTDMWTRYEDILSLLEFAVHAMPLAARNLVGILTTGDTAQKYEQLVNELDSCARVLDKKKKKNTAWKEPLEPEDTQNALVQTEAFEKSSFRYFRPSYWRLRKTLFSRYDFAQHAVAPTWTKILKDLAAEHDAQARYDLVQTQARKEWQTGDEQAFRNTITELLGKLNTSSATVKSLVLQLANNRDAPALFEQLAAVYAQFQQLEVTLRALLVDHREVDFPELPNVLKQLRMNTGGLTELLPVLSEVCELPDSFSQALRQVELPLPHFESALARKSLNQVYRNDRSLIRLDGRALELKMANLAKLHQQWLTHNAQYIRAAVRQIFLDHVNTAAQSATQLSPEQKTVKKTYSSGRRDLEHEFGKSMRYKSIRELAAGDTGQVIKDLKPIWLMSPLSVSDTLPLDSRLFDVVIFDEASQIPMEEAIPALYRSNQVIVVGDEMQLPPTTFFASSRGEQESVVVEEDGESYEVDLDSDSFLTQSAQNLPSTLLAWHYRSRYESLISFSNSAFYAGQLYTIPDKHLPIGEQQEIRVTSVEQGTTNIQALLSRSISFHYMEIGLYQERTNPNEATYIAHLVRALLAQENHPSIGVVAFSEAQQSEIENALTRLADDHADFAAQLESEYVREENDVFCGLFVKNLENVQGDERDIIIMSVCYGPDANGKMLMNFGPINQRGGEKRLNVIFSRARHHMAIVSSIRHNAITNDYNDGANSLKRFLHYAEAVSKGDATTARKILENLNPLSRRALEPTSTGDAVVQELAVALKERGYTIDLNVGQSKFRCDLALRSGKENKYQLGILVDTDGHYANTNLLDRYLMQPSILRAFDWQIMMVFTKDWYHDPKEVLARIEKVLS